MSEFKASWRKAWFVAVIVFGAVVQTNAAAVIKNLQVEYRSTPLGIDVSEPRFSWQMATTAGERGYSQAAHRIEVKDPKGEVSWDSKRIEESRSVGIKYAGSRLRAATRYSWTVTVWSQTGEKLTASSWFETGLMDPKLDSSVWGGAKWIGGTSDDLVLYAPYLAIFDVKYALSIAPGSTHASFVYGAN
ncbi:MAG: alpha-L-rhamnosidase, partial [Acidobacteria bacterium]